MRITLNQTEIEQAIKNFVGEQGVDTRGKSVTVKLTAGRGENGHSADVDIEAIAVELTDTTAKGIELTAVETPAAKSEESTDDKEAPLTDSLFGPK